MASSFVMALAQAKGNGQRLIDIRLERVSIKKKIESRKAAIKQHEETIKEKKKTDPDNAARWAVFIGKIISQLSDEIQCLQDGLWRLHLEEESLLRKG